MNLGIYISDIADTENISAIYKFVDENINNKELYDISIFYNNIAHNPHNIKCGMFNSTELWSFNGNLITTSLDTLNTALNIVNNINVFYYHGWKQEKNTMNLILLSQRNIKIICKTNEDAKEIYRLTGKNVIGISQNYENIIDLLMGCEDEYQSNNNDVYQTA